MTKTFAASQTQASKAIAAAASRAVTAGMILASERDACIKSATASIRLSGSTYICGETISLTRSAQDGIKAAAIRNMSDAQFDRLAVGL